MQIHSCTCIHLCTWIHSSTWIHSYTWIHPWTLIHPCTLIHSVTWIHSITWMHLFLYLIICSALQLMRLSSASEHSQVPFCIFLLHKQLQTICPFPSEKKTSAKLDSCSHPIVHCFCRSPSSSVIFSPLWLLPLETNMSDFSQTSHRDLLFF